ncbi:YncE family protein [Mongoliitalea daihaiensis]|uniref:hypothetical protein n=1 Tax=Mongoliitalea daihaiensis TaxID=2782006 RepID=UPI001F1E5A5C|nr:hypothetical protein [Mongoliitalea daihaiensis]UJP66708.1 hypothetical protein IPZ59_09030 [Mongoliitalea daihaiensis]
MNFTKCTSWTIVGCIFLCISFLYACGPDMDSWEGSERLDVSHEQLLFESLVQRKKLTIFNTSNQPVSWSLESSSNQIISSPFGGLLPANGIVEAEVWLINVPANEQVFQGLLTLKAEDKVAREIEIVAVASQQKRWSLDVQITDAVYDSHRDRIWALSDNRQLLEIDPVGQTVRSIPLEIQGIKLSIHPSGERLVVGHESAFSYLELPSGQLIRRRSFPFKLHDIAIAPNHWIYATASQEQHSQIYCVNALGTEEGYSYMAPIYSNASISVHPSGDYLLLASTVISPDDVYKFSIQEGWAHLRYDSPYHGEHRFGGKTWFDPSGERFFTRTGNVFQFTDEQIRDLRYLTKIPAPNPFVFIAHGVKTPRIYAVHDVNFERSFPTSAQPILSIYSSSYQIVSSTVLPKILRVVNGQVEELGTDIFTGFFDREEKNFFILEKTKELEGVKPTWSILTFPV